MVIIVAMVLVVMVIMVVMLVILVMVVVVSMLVMVVTTGQDRTGQNCHLNLTFQVTWDWQRDKFAMFLAKSFKICLVQDYKKNTFCLGEAG